MARGQKERLNSFARISSYFTQNSQITNQTGDSVYNLYGDIARKFWSASVDVFSDKSKESPRFVVKAVGLYSAVWGIAEDRYDS